MLLAVQMAIAIMNSGMVHTRLRDGAKKVSKASAKRIKKSAADTLNNNAKLSGIKGSAYERRLQARKLGLQDEIWSNSDPMDASIDWFSTFVHEMGHQVHFQVYAKARKALYELKRHDLSDSIQS